MSWNLYIKHKLPLISNSHLLVYHSILKKKKGGSKDSLIPFFKKETVPFNFTPTLHSNFKAHHLIVLVMDISKMRFYIPLPQLLVIRKPMLSFIEGVWSCWCWCIPVLKEIYLKCYIKPLGHVFNLFKIQADIRSSYRVF